MTACLLVPEETFDAAFAGQAPTEATATELAQLFRFYVSRELCVPKVSRPRSYHCRRLRSGSATLGRSKRQDGEDRQLGRQVPTGLIDDQHRMGTGIDGGTDLDEVRRHGVGVAPGHDQPGALPLRGTDRAEDIGPFGALVAGRPRARATSGPSGGDHYNTKIAYLGTEYINLAFQRFYQNRIDYNQLADILDTKPKNLTWLEEYVSRKAP